MSLSRAVGDHRREALVFCLLHRFSEIGIHLLYADQLQRAFPFYLFMLACYGVRDTGFYCNSIVSTYPELDSNLSAAVTAGFIRRQSNSREEIFVLPCAPSTLLRLNNDILSILEPHERHAAHKAATLAEKAYSAKALFRDAVAATYQSVCTPSCSRR